MVNENEPTNIADVQAAAYRAYAQAMKEGMAKLDVEALDIPPGGESDPMMAMAMPSHCVGTLYCMGHFGCAGGCVMCFGTVGTVMCSGGPKPPIVKKPV
jgi:hypothetical protein